MRWHGWAFVQRVGKTGDFGADITARGFMFAKIVVQCKHYAKPVGVKADGSIPCEPQSVFNVTLRFMAEDETAVTVPISSPLLIPWYDCKVTAFNPNEIEDSMDVWLDYCPYVVKKWKNKVLFDDESEAGA